MYETSDYWTVCLPVRTTTETPLALLVASGRSFFADWLPILKPDSKLRKKEVKSSRWSRARSVASFLSSIHHGGSRDEGQRNETVSSRNRRELTFQISRYEEQKNLSTEKQVVQTNCVIYCKRMNVVLKQDLLLFLLSGSIL